MQGSLVLFRRRLLAWYDRQRRELPWRCAKAIGLGSPAMTLSRIDPYRVLVSEIMLQQTQVATVIPYFRRFMARFPTIRTLARAKEQEVLRFWQGLGYYHRAKNLQAACRMIATELGDRFPTRAHELRQL